MTNIVFSPALQAPITLSNPTGSISCASDPGSSNHQTNPIPNQGALALVGSAVRLALTIAANTGAASFATAAPNVVAGLVTPRSPTVGSLAATGTVPTLSVASGATPLTFPRIMLCGVGGDQGFGRTSGYPWTTAANGTTANTAIQTIGAYDIAAISGVFENWDSGGTYDRDNLTQALGKKAATYTVTKNNARATLVFYYEIMNATILGNPYAQWQTLVDANNWYLYESAAGVGTKTPAGGGQFFINYSAAWPGAVGSAGIGVSICGSNYGTTSSGSPTGAQGPARAFGNYAAIKLLSRGYSGDSRFSFNAQMGSPSAAGIFLDECFAALDGAGTVPDSSLDGLTLAHGSPQGGGFPGLDTPQSLLARGNRNMFDQLQTMLALVNPGKTYYNFANFGQYANKYQFGISTLTAGLEGTLHGGLLESVLGAGAASWECYQTGNPNTGNTSYASGWPNLLANYYQGMDFCQAPKLVGLGTKLPATDGSQTASWPVGAGTTLTTVTAGTALEYQLMRYGLCTTLLDDGYFAPGVNGYDWSLVRWYDEYGDDSLTQVNVKRGYLGVPLTTRPIAATWSQGTLGVWSRSFTNGIAIVNPRGNGVQTVTLPGSYTKLVGTQQPSINNGATVSGVSLADGDGLILLGPVGLPDYSWSATVSGSAKSASAGFIAAVAFNSGVLRTVNSYQGGRIFPVNSAGTVDLYFERVLGETGSISITISTSSATNTTSGTHFTSISGATLTWADGEIGWKRVSVSVLAIPTGFGLVQLNFTGAAYRPNAWVWLRGTGLVPGAKFFQSSNGVNVAGNASGNGSAGSPWLGLSNAIVQMGSTGGVLYWIQNGSNGHTEWSGTPGANNGIRVNGFNAPSANPLIILPHPSNASQAFMDQGSTAGGANILFSNAPALYYFGSGSNMWLVGIHFYRGGVQYNSQDVLAWTNNVMWQCEADNYSISASSNVHCVRLDYTKNFILQDCFIHNSYTTEQGTQNSYTAVASGMESAVGAFYAGGGTVAHCHMKQCQHGLMNKEAPKTITDTLFEVTHCLAEQMQSSPSSGGVLVGYPVQVEGWQNSLIRYSVYDGTNDKGPTSGSLVFAQDNIAQSTNMDIYNCVSITGAVGGGGLGQLSDVTGWRIFNCISQDSTNTNNEIKIHSPDAGKTTQLLISDYNIYVRGSHTWTYNYGGSTTSVSPLSAWQATAPNAFLANFNDTHSIATNTTPAYGNISVNNYRVANSGGRGNQPIGVGNEYVGVVNNFLNPSLPLAG